VPESGRVAGNGTCRSAADIARKQQALHHLTVFQVGFDDFVDVLQVDVAVPHAFGLHHGHRPRSATVQATRLVHAHLARSVQAGGLDLLFAALEAGLSILAGTAGLTIGAGIQAKKDVALKVGSLL
jgi:hypothetical protein